MVWDEGEGLSQLNAQLGVQPTTCVEGCGTGWKDQDLQDHLCRPNFLSLQQLTRRGGSHVSCTLPPLAGYDRASYTSKDGGFTRWLVQHCVTKQSHEWDVRKAERDGP